MTAYSQREIITGNYRRVLAEMAEACQRVHRKPEEVRLVAVTKYASLSAIKDLVSLGQLDLGENKPQQLLLRREQIASPIRWHLIGNLQRNKVQQVLQGVTLLHAVDSWKLLERIETVASQQQLVPEILLELNVSGEATKHGFSPSEYVELIAQFDKLTHLKICGLMTMAPLCDDPETARPVFRQLRELRELYPQGGMHPMHELSMGMSNDFPIAIEEGATIVRIGSSLFSGLMEDEA